MLRIPNIYKYKHLELLVIIPVIMVIISAFLATGIELDTSLKGGVSIILQTSSNISASQLAGEVSARLGSQAPSIARSPGGIQITLSTNQSLANAEGYLQDFYVDKANYTAYYLNVTTISLALQHSIGNTTLLGELATANAQANHSLIQMQGAVQSELGALRPFNLQYTVNGSDVNEMQSVAQNAYTNASNLNKANLINTLHSIVDFSSYSYEEVTPTLGTFFLSQLTDILIIAFVLIFIVVLVIFRSPVPSVTVVFGAASDIVVALGAMGLFHIPLGVASIAGLLMLLGYSIDTDVLTAIRILKRGEGKAEDRAYASMMTGITMTMTAIVSFAALFAISIIEYVPTYYEIAGVVLLGLIGDVVTTWLADAALLLIYKRRKERV